jgi:hypothetical protein
MINQVSDLPVNKHLAALPKPIHSTPFHKLLTAARSAISVGSLLLEILTGKALHQIGSLDKVSAIIIRAERTGCACGAIHPMRKCSMIPLELIG